MSLQYVLVKDQILSKYKLLHCLVRSVALLKFDYIALHPIITLHPLQYITITPNTTSCAMWPLVLFALQISFSKAAYCSVVSFQLKLSNAIKIHPYLLFGETRTTSITYELLSKIIQQENILNLITSNFLFGEVAVTMCNVM